MGGQCALRWCGRTSKEPKARSERPAEPRENTGANRRGSILEPPKSATLPNLANAATAGISPQKLAIGEKVPPGGLTGRSPQVGPVCEATSPLATLGPARSKPPSRSAQVEMKENPPLLPLPPPHHQSVFRVVPARLSSLAPDTSLCRRPAYFHVVGPPWTRTGPFRGTGPLKGAFAPLSR